MGQPERKPDGKPPDVRAVIQAHKKELQEQYEEAKGRRAKAEEVLKMLEQNVEAIFGAIQELASIEKDLFGGPLEPKALGTLNLDGMKVTK